LGSRHRAKGAQEENVVAQWKVPARGKKRYFARTKGEIAMQPTLLKNDGCRLRQERLNEFLSQQALDAALITDWRDVYYFTGVISYVPYPRALLLGPGRDSLLIAENEYPSAVVDRQQVYPFHTFATLNFEPNEELILVLRDAMPHRARRLGVQYETLLFQVARVLNKETTEFVPIDQELLQMQAVKDNDEIEVLRRAAELNDVGYAAVQKAIKEGASEAEVLAAGKEAVTSAAGCDCYYSGDFQCAQPGGFATDRPCQAGELFIVDAAVTYQGYWSDNCRTFAVTTIDKKQREAWQATEETVLMAEEMIRPGVRGREVFHSMKQMQDRIKEGALVHHGGHGIGLRGHGYPRINPHFDDFFAEGNTFTIEPGVYGEELRGGIRLEYNYLLTAKGLERLNHFPVGIPSSLI
jgi:Xaa-Pro aminopeptidase